ncbi:MAG: copper amine oxidase N-terminal domain-containing protein [Bacillota bacterium]
MGRLKRFVLVLVLVLMAAVPCWGYDVPDKEVEFTEPIDGTTGGHPGGFGDPNGILVMVNGEAIYFPDAKPYVNSDGRAMVPVRFVAEELGADVGWNNATQTVSIIKGNTSISLTVGRRGATVNGKEIVLDTAAVLEKDRTLVPVRFISEAFGAEVKWVPPMDYQRGEVWVTLGGGQ